jgi:hypothetical protein
MRRDLVPLTLLLFLAAAIPCSAQEYEIAPYAGGFFPGKFAGLIEVGKEGIYGVRGGFFLTHNFEAEGQFGYISNLSFKNTLTRKKAYIWEGGATYNLGARRKFYATFGIGEVTTTVSDDTRSLFDPSILTSDHFLSLSYGGGIKALRRWGPFGYRADVRGRTLPSYYGFRFSWLEATAGPTFSWGER